MFELPFVYPSLDGRGPTRAPPVPMVLFLWHNARVSERGAGYGFLDNKIPDNIWWAMRDAYDHQVVLDDFGTSETVEYTPSLDGAGELKATYTVIGGGEQQGDPVRVRVQYTYTEPNPGGRVWIVRGYLLDRWGTLCLSRATFDLHID